MITTITNITIITSTIDQISLDKKSPRIGPEDKSLAYQGSFPIENIVKIS